MCRGIFLPAPSCLEMTGRLPMTSMTAWDNLVILSGVVSRYGRPCQTSTATVLQTSTTYNKIIVPSPVAPRKQLHRWQTWAHPTVQPFSDEFSVLSSLRQCNFQAAFPSPRGNRNTPPRYILSVTPIGYLLHPAFCRLAASDAFHAVIW